jgi:hypothetical protein
LDNRFCVFGPWHDPEILGLPHPVLLWRAFHETSGAGGVSKGRMIRSSIYSAVSFTGRRGVRVLAALVGLFFLGTANPAHGCTIFVLTDARRALFFNNEDWSNPSSRLWFVPAGLGFFGCAFVGFDDGWSQGGVNTEGLAFDWVAGYEEKWQPDPRMKSVRGNPAQRMIETCQTVDEAIAFFQTHWEPSFFRARIMVADKSGASVILGAKNGKLRIEKTDRCRGFGFGGEIVQRMLDQDSTVSVGNGKRILGAALQQGTYATKYSTVYDLKTGDISFLQFSGGGEVSLNLEAELKKGPHYYEIPSLRKQLAEDPRPLRNEMKRFLLDEFKPVKKADSVQVARVRRLIEDAARGSMRSKDYAGEFWKQIEPAGKQIQGELGRLGGLNGIVPVELSGEVGSEGSYYRLDFSLATLVQRINFDAKGRVTKMTTTAVELKPERRGSDQ